MNPSATKKSPYERYTGQEPNIIKRIVTNTTQFFSEKPEIELTPEFESGQDSTIMIRERARGSKLEGAFKKRKGTLLENSNHTITFLPAGRTASRIISKRDLGHIPNDKPCCSKWPIRNAERKQTTQVREQIIEERSEPLLERNQQHENEQPIENEMNEIANQKETPSKEPIKGQTAKQKLNILKKRAKQQQQKNKMKREKTWLKQLDTILSESDSEEEQKREEETNGEEEEEKVTTEEDPKTDQQQRRGDKETNPISSGITLW